MGDDEALASLQVGEQASCDSLQVQVGLGTALDSPCLSNWLQRLVGWSQSVPSNRGLWGRPLAGMWRSPSRLRALRPDSRINIWRTFTEIIHHAYSPFKRIPIA